MCFYILLIVQFFLLYGPSVWRKFAYDLNCDHNGTIHSVDSSYIDVQSIGRYQ